MSVGMLTRPCHGRQGSPFTIVLQFWTDKTKTVGRDMTAVSSAWLAELRANPTDTAAAGVWSIDASAARGSVGVPGVIKLSVDSDPNTALGAGRASRELGWDLVGLDDNTPVVSGLYIVDAANTHPSGDASPSPSTSTAIYDVVVLGEATTSLLEVDVLTGDQGPQGLPGAPGGFVAPAGTPSDYVPRVAADGSIEWFDPNGIYAPLPKLADTGYDVWLLAGQSNMQGHGLGLDVTYLDAPVPGRVLQLANPNGTPTYGDQVVVGVDPLFHFAQWANSVGHPMTFARDLLATTLQTRKILLVPTAQGSTGFSTGSGTLGCWDPAGGFTAPDLYNDAITQANKAMALGVDGVSVPVGQVAPGNVFRGVLWHQGEADSSLTGPQYQAKLDALIDGFRASIVGATDSVFLLGQLMDLAIAGAPGAYGPINAVHIDTPRRKTRAGFYYSPSGTDPTMQNGDNAHFSAKGQRVIGHRAAAILPVAEANVTGTPPLAPPNVYLTQSGTSALVTWDRPAARFTDFNVRWSADGGATWTTLTRTSPDIDNSATITGLTLGHTYKIGVNSVNEQGTSDWSVSQQLPMVFAPGQAGLALGSPGPFNVPYTITPPTVDSTHAAATSYRVEYSSDGGTTWTTFATVTALTGLIVGLADSTAYKVKVTAINAAGDSASSSTVQSVTTTAPNPLLDDVAATAFRAVGLRKLRGAYAGNCIQVRRSSDNATMDVGFVAGTNNLDTATMLAWSGSDSVFISKWYDQSGNARDRVQATAANQMRLVNAGTLDTMNGKPVAVPTSTSAVYSDATVGLYAAGAATCLAVCVAGTVNGGSLVNEKGTSSSYQLIQTIGTSGTLEAQIRDDAGTAVATATGTIATGTALAQMTTIDTGTQLTARVNAAQSGSSAYSRSGHTLTLTASQFGQLSPSGAWTSGKVAEAVVFASALTSAQYLAGEANQKKFYSTP